MWRDNEDINVIKVNIIVRFMMVWIRCYYVCLKLRSWVGLFCFLILNFYSKFIENR